MPGRSSTSVCLTETDGVSRRTARRHDLWLMVASARMSGEVQKKGADTRDALASVLPPARVADAAQRAREWMEAFERRTP